MYTLNPQQLAYLQKACRDKVVHDLGCGTGDIAKLASARAQAIHLVDKEENAIRAAKHKSYGCPVHYHQKYFTDYNPKLPEVALLSWPVNQYQAISEILYLLRLFPTVIYIGSNTNGNQCATPTFWEEALKHPLIHTVRDQAQCLHHYDWATTNAPVTPRNQEEEAGMFCESGMAIVTYS